MAPTEWEPSAVKAQLRLTSLRLGQLQDKKDSQANITRKDIATLLQQRNVILARTKAYALIQEDAMGDLLEILEMHVGLILEHFSELERTDSLSPNVVEAASSIIFAAPQVDSKDLNSVRDLLVHRLGPDFAHSASGNYDNHVPPNVLRVISTLPPSAATLDSFLENTARNYGVKWSPEPRRHDLVNTISEILDSSVSPIVDLVRLRQLCSRGLPDQPAWLRPRIWKLCFGILPVLKASWNTEIHKQRESYYDLTRRLLEPFSSLPPPSTPLRSMDAALIRASKQLLAIPSSMLGEVGEELEPSILCPLDDMAPDEIKITSACNLDVRLKALQGNSGASVGTPQILLESDADETPGISLSSSNPGALETHNKQTTLLPANVAVKSRHHSTALLRLLYIHASINPRNRSPHIPSLLVPIYAVLCHEIDPTDLAHVEADTFWLFEAMIGEFSELEDEEGGNVWMKRFSERLAWADVDLADNLQAKGLDPALPHYSYRWLAPLLTHTLPLPSVYLIWDGLFSCSMRDRNTNPKLDYLLDICTSMLIRARGALFRLGKTEKKSPTLWIEENMVVPPPSPLRAWELGDAFLEGISLLQNYPIDSAGGIDALLQTASDLRHRREEDAKLDKGSKVGLGTRLKVTMWKGFTNQVASPDTSPVESEEESSDEVIEDGNDTETQEKRDTPGLTSRFATTVWRGITNKTSMEAPLSPIWPASTASPNSSPTTNMRQDSGREGAISHHSSSSQGSSGLWGYAEKLKDSDAAAAIAKVSTNWRAKALISPWRRAAPVQAGSEPVSPASPSTQRDPLDKISRTGEMRRGSLPPLDRTSVYSPPPRPLHFRSPRDSSIFPTTVTRSPTSTEPSSEHGDSFVRRAVNLQTSLTSLTRSKNPQPAAKSAPKPLLLSANLALTSPTVQSVSRSSISAPIPDRSQWAEVMRLKGHSMHRDSQSSISSLSPSDALGRPFKSGWESDHSSAGRLVPLNRRSVSPMAPGFRVQRSRPASSSSVASSDKGSSQALSSLGEIRIKSSQEVSTIGLLSSGTTWTGTEQPSIKMNSPSALHSKKITSKRTSPPLQGNETSDSSPLETFSKSPRLRSKRYPVRPHPLNLQEPTSRQAAAERKLSNPNTLAVDWPNEDQDIANTPRATTFQNDVLSQTPPLSRSPRRSRKVSTETTPERPRKSSTDGHETRLRKTSTNQRIRKISGDTGSVIKQTRESSADEGDDEGYDDLLSAYESEEGLK